MSTETPHVTYWHVEKTGGSAIECATQQWQVEGYWDNMGHTSNRRAGSACQQRCDAAGVRVANVISVREPYAYWESVYKYAWLSWKAGNEDSAVTYYLRRRGQLAVLADYSAFMRFMGDDIREHRLWAKPDKRGVWAGVWAHFAQSQRVEKSCGS